MNARGDFAMFMKKIGMILLAFMLILCNGASASALTVQASFNDPLIEEAVQAFAGDAVTILDSGQNVLQSTLWRFCRTNRAYYKACCPNRARSIFTF